MKSLGDVAMCIGGHVKDLLLFFLRARIDILYRQKKRNGQSHKRRSGI